MSFILFMFFLGLVLGIFGTCYWSSSSLSKEEKDAIDDLYKSMKK